MCFHVFLCFFYGFPSDFAGFVFQIFRGFSLSFVGFCGFCRASNCVFPVRNLQGNELWKFWL